MVGVVQLNCKGQRIHIFMCGGQGLQRDCRRLCVHCRGGWYRGIVKVMCTYAESRVCRHQQYGRERINASPAVSHHQRVCAALSSFLRFSVRSQFPPRRSIRRLPPAALPTLAGDDTASWHPFLECICVGRCIHCRFLHVAYVYDLFLLVYCLNELQLQYQHFRFK